MHLNQRNNLNTLLRLKNNGLKVLTLFTCVLLYSLKVFPYSGFLPVLATKQPASKICFISNDGLYTYFQRKPATLMLASRYTLKEVLSGPEDAFFTMKSSTAHKKMLIEMDPFFHLAQGITDDKFIYAVDFGSTITTVIGRGMNSQLHLNDSWASFYQMQTKNLSFQSLSTPTAKSKFQIHINSSLNPYFIPQVVMYDDQSILFTDISSDGRQALFLLKRNTKEMVLLLKTKKPGMKIELCLNRNNLFVGQFGYPEVKNTGSEISFIDLAVGKDFSKLKSLYSSKQQNDIGNLECNVDSEFIYFIQNQSPIGNSLFSKSEAVSLSLKDKKIKTISDLGNVTQIINLDGRLIIPFQGEVYVAKGNNKVDNDSLKSINATNFKNIKDISNKDFSTKDLSKDSTKKNSNKDNNKDNNKAKSKDNSKKKN